MNKTERFRRMKQVEGSVEKLVKKGWRVQRIVYDDESNEPLHATITLTIEGKGEKDGVL